MGGSGPPEGPSSAEGTTDQKDCPSCGNAIPAAARVCRLCGYEFETGRRPEAWVPLPEYGQPPMGIGARDPLAPGSAAGSPRAADPLAGGPAGSAAGLPPPLTLHRPPAGNNGHAVASLALGILWIWGIGSILAIVLGYGAKAQIDRSGGTQSGRGLAIAGIVLGWIGVAGTIVLLLLFAAATRSVESL